MRIARGALNPYHPSKMVVRIEGQISEVIMRVLNGFVGQMVIVYTRDGEYHFGHVARCIGCDGRSLVLSPCVQVESGLPLREMEGTMKSKVVVNMLSPCFTSMELLEDHQMDDALAIQFNLKKDRDRP